MAAISDLPFLLFMIASLVLFGNSHISVAEFANDGKVLELDNSNFDSVIANFDYVFVDFYAPWCGHCKRLSPELDKAAPVLAGLKVPVVVAKVNVDKHVKFASRFKIDGYPTLKVFVHGIPTEYKGPRKAEVLVQFLTKFTAPDVSILKQDSGVNEFVETSGTDFPIFIGFGLNESLLAGFGKKYKKKTWFSVAKDFSEELMIKYDFDKVPALVYFHPKYKEHGVFYGPFEGSFLEDFIQQNQLPLAVPINYETLKLLNEDKRKIALTFVDDEFNEDASRLIKTLKAAASANRDLVFGYVGMKQWDEFVYTFDIKTKTKLPKMVIWNGLEDYYISEDLESLDGDDQFSQLSLFLQEHRDGKLVHKRLSGPSVMSFLMQRTTIYMLVIVLLVFALLMYMALQSPPDTYPTRPRENVSGSPSDESKEEYRPSVKED